MARVLTFVTLANVCCGVLLAESSPYNKNHGPFEPDKWPTVVRLKPCEKLTRSGGRIAEFDIYARHRLKDNPAAATILMARMAGWPLTWTLVLSPERKLLAGPEPILGQSRGRSQVYQADLNGDGKDDFLIKTSLGGCGTIYTFSCNLTFVLSTRDTFGIVSTEGLWSGPDYFVDVNGDGLCEFIHTRFVSGRGVVARDGKQHNYWVYNLLELKAGKATIRNDLVPSFPKWIWYTYKPNHQATTMITKAQKKFLWGKVKDPIFWKPASYPVVETVWQKGQTEDLGPLILVFDPKRRQSDYEAPARSSLPLDDPYVTARGTDKGLIRVHTSSGKRQKRYTLPREQLRGVVDLHLGACIVEDYEYVFTVDKVVVVHRSNSNGGIFSGSDIWEIPYQKQAEGYEKYLETYDRIDRGLFKIALDFHARRVARSIPSGGRANSRAKLGP